MLEIFAIPAINRLLRANTWALDSLKPHAGKVASFSSPPFRFTAAITPTGELTQAPDGTAPDVTIQATPGVLARLAARDEAAWNAAQVSGDMQFAAALDHVRRNLRWDYEEDLSRMVGDIAAHRIGNALRGLDSWGRTTLANLGQSAAEYATYEQPLVASAPALEAFCREVDELRDDAARLEKRIELLARQLGR